jgi:hypothetical protein
MTPAVHSLRRFPNPLLAALAVCLVVATHLEAAASGDGQARPAAPLAYDLSAYELAPAWRQTEHPWTARELKQAIKDRAAIEKRRHQMDVYYYRIGYTISYPLPLAARPTRLELPVGIAKMTYPWLIWLAWDLEERWRLLDAAWHRFGDREAGVLLQRELAALSGWDHFREVDGNVGLVTGHIAAALSVALADTSGWEPERLRLARAAAEELLDRDVWPWFQTHWPERELTPGQIGNIPVIALVRSAQLARVVGSPHQAALEKRSREVLSAWCRFRTGPEHHTEGAGYDGYLLDSITEWLAGLPDRPQVLKESREAFCSQAEHWINLTVPGRCDLQAPLGDVEPEMTFWATALMRLEGWYNWQDAGWLLHRFPLDRLRAPALVCALAQGPGPRRAVAASAGPHELPNALSLRTGWEQQDLLAVVGLSRGTVGHLHADGGQLILGWQGCCWITDPGYQQYRPGEEREYTLGAEAHNAPVIATVVQTQRAARAEVLETSGAGRQHARVDLSACYKGLPTGATIHRDVWLLNDAGQAVVARDTLSALGRDVQVSTSWQGGAHLAWAFRQGWARLSDGERALWVGTYPGTLEAAQLTRHPGSRGPLTLTQTARLPEGEGARWWVFVCDPTCGWQPPSLEVANGMLRLTAPGGHQPSRPIE